MAAASAGGLQVALVPVGWPADAQPDPIEVVATLAGGVGERRVSLSPPRARNTHVALDLAPGVWTIAVLGSGLWSHEESVHVRESSRPDVRLRFWPTATMVAEPTSRLPSQTTKVVAHFRGSPSVAPLERVPESVTPCGLERGRISCTVPASRLDVRLVASGLIPEYYWDVVVKGRETRPLGAFRVETGGSVIGYMRQATGDQPAADAQVELLTAGGGRIPAKAPADRAPRTATDPDPERLRFPLRSATNPRGFFQVRGVSPGEYRVVAMGGGGDLAESTVVVETDAESALPDALVLEHPYSLDVSVDPPTHPRGGPWTLTLTRLSPFEALRTQVVPESGATRVERIGRGRYFVEVTGEGDLWFRDSFEVDSPPGPLAIQIRPVSVRGRIRLAGKPLQATLQFGGKRPPGVTLPSDAYGEFEGLLPAAGKWPLWVFAPSARPAVDRMVRAVEITPDDTGRATVEIDLDDARLSGRVTDEAGRGVKAFVRLMPAGARLNTLPQTFTSDPDGRFEAGLAPGDYVVSADAEGWKRSRPTLVEVTEGGAEVALIVQESLEVRGRIFSAATGRPLAGAQGHVRPADQPLTGVPHTFADAQGEFTLRLPRGTRAVELLFWADGHAVYASREAITPGQELVLSLGQLGGTLVLDVPVDQRAVDGESVIAVLHRGAALSIRDLQRTSPPAIAKAPPEDQSTVALPNLEPGDYALCAIGRDAFFARAPVDAASCAGGSLAPGGELKLSSPRGRQPS